MSYKEQLSYQSLRNIVSERTKRLVIFAGAGLSTSANLPLWATLRDELCSRYMPSGIDEQSTPEQRKIASLLNLAKNEENLWRAFDYIIEAVKDRPFISFIRERFSSWERTSVPKPYTLIWKLPIQAVLTTNIDRFVERAQSESNRNFPPITFVGKDIHSHIHALKETRPFVAYLHGQIDNAESWVFKSSDWDRLNGSDAYGALMTSVFANYTVLFVGISATDKAAGGHLLKLSKLGMDLGDHFWITSKTDSASMEWARECGVQVVNYRVDEDGSHDELSDLLESLVAHKPVDADATPVRPPTATSQLSGTHSVEELRQRSAVGLREILNQMATVALQQDAESNSTENYDRFLDTYAEFVYRSWYVSVDKDANDLLGYTLIKEVASGAFGRVFEARSRSNHRVAVKLLNEYVMRDRGMLKCFRRGVRSMQILSDREVKGMVPYLDAAEIPAFAVMEYVDGPNLQDFSAIKQLQNWPIILRIGADLVKTIRAAHSVPERVLHRDLRPSNIMLKNFWTEPSHWEVVVLDFDLAWYQGATEKSVIGTTTSLQGFLAPEQLGLTKHSTRSALVDSYGFGMLMFFLRLGRNPRQGEHRDKEWKSTLQSIVRKFPCQEWVSLPTRFIRLIEYATLDEQPARWDISQIELEITRLRAAIESPRSVRSEELLAEELAARVSLDTGEGLSYSFAESELRFTIDNGFGTSCKVVPNLQRSSLELYLEWTSSGVSQHGKVRKGLKPAIDSVCATMKAGGWTTLAAPTYTAGSTHMGFYAASVDFSASLESRTKCVLKATRILSNLG